MIYLFHGTDVAKVRAKAFEWVSKARAKESDIAYQRLAKEEITVSALYQAASSGGLFVTRTLTLIDDPFALAQRRDESDDDEEEGEGADIPLIEHVDLLATSDNVFVVLAPKLSAPLIKKLAPNAARVYEYLAPVVAKRGFNSRLVDALGAKSGAALWLELQRAFAAGDPPELVHGLLHWKARDLMRKGSRVWSPEASRRLSIDLLTLLQSSRRGGLPLILALERFALAL